MELELKVHRSPRRQQTCTNSRKYLSFSSTLTQEQSVQVWHMKVEFVQLFFDMNIGIPFSLLFHCNTIFAQAIASHNTRQWQLCWLALYLLSHSREGRRIWRVPLTPAHSGGDAIRSTLNVDDKLVHNGKGTSPFPATELHS